jgi:hypothetical protein
MPNQDGTGPEGKGPLTGQGKGPCAKKRKLDGTGPEGKGPRTGRGMGNCPK